MNIGLKCYQFDSDVHIGKEASHDTLYKILDFFKNTIQHEELVWEFHFTLCIEIRTVQLHAYYQPQALYL
jgi:hypothetical protein